MKLPKSTVSNYIITGILCFTIGFFASTKFNKNYDNLDYINFISKQDSLNLVIDSLRKENQKIITKIDYRSDTIEKVRIEYETNINNMLHQPIDSQCRFFSKYILSQETRFIDSNNSTTTKDN